MPHYPTIKIPVYNIPLSEMAEGGFEPSDNGSFDAEMFSALGSEDIMKLLTRRQYRLITLLKDGKTRKSAASTIGVSLQAVHQMILRIRKRLKTKGVQK